MVPDGSHDQESPGWPPAYYGTEYGQCHDGQVTREWPGNAVQAGLQSGGPTGLEQHLNAVQKVAHQTLRLQQSGLYAGTAFLHPENVQVS